MILAITAWFPRAPNTGGGSRSRIFCDLRRPVEIAVDLGPRRSVPPCPQLRRVFSGLAQSCAKADDGADAAGNGPPGFLIDLSRDHQALPMAGKPRPPRRRRSCPRPRRGDEEGGQARPASGCRQLYFVVPAHQPGAGPRVAPVRRRFSAMCPGQQHAPSLGAAHGGGRPSLAAVLGELPFAAAVPSGPAFDIEPQRDDADWPYFAGRASCRTAKICEGPPRTASLPARAGSAKRPASFIVNQSLLAVTRLRPLNRRRITRDPASVPGDHVGVNRIRCRAYAASDARRARTPNRRWRRPAGHVVEPANHALARH